MELHKTHKREFDFTWRLSKEWTWICNETNWWDIWSEKQILHFCGSGFGSSASFLSLENYAHFSAFVSVEMMLMEVRTSTTFGL